MIGDREQFIRFLIQAKRNTYAAGGEPVASSRPASHDLQYQEGDFLYIDTYLGGFHFAGEEAVWKAEAPVWSMNYYGHMQVQEVPPGFGEFLKAALLQVPAKAPYRGPALFHQGDFEYRCQWQGSLECFLGSETISLRGMGIYELWFHGGEIR